ncbi:MAG: hypothetical protein MZV70_42875 [Desulfobacterales bacterium]|nr:hypothetical protein [Desulfobacterales bacterium]
MKTAKSPARSGEGLRRLRRREELDVLRRRRSGSAVASAASGRDADGLLAPHDELDVDVAPVRLELHLLGRARLAFGEHDEHVVALDVGPSERAAPPGPSARDTRTPARVPRIPGVDDQFLMLPRTTAPSCLFGDALPCAMRGNAERQPGGHRRRTHTAHIQGAHLLALDRSALRRSTQSVLKLVLDEPARARA